MNAPEPLDRAIKNARRHKFYKELSKAKEIKSNKSSPELKMYLIKRLNEIDGIQGVHCILDKGKVYSEYLKNDKNKLYNYVAGSLASAILVDSDNVEVRIDKSKGKSLLREDFNSYFEKKLRIGSTIGKVRIFHSNSENFSGIQIADLLAWSIYQNYNNSDPSYLDLIDLQKFPQTFVELWKSRK